MAADPPGDRARVASDPGLIEAIRIDLARLHEGWLGIAYPQRKTLGHAVLGKWRPDTPGARLRFRIWSWIGIPIIAFLYPLAVAGFAIRFYSRRIDRSAASLGLAGVLVLSIVVWGALTVLAMIRFSHEGFIAVAAAAGVATVSAGLALIFSRIGGRWTTVILAYPFAVTAIFLPPVVAALYSPVLASIVFPGSQVLAIWLLDTVLAVGGINEILRTRFDLVGIAYVGMWFGLAVPVGWFLGLLVTLANVVRPSDADGEDRG